MNKAGREGIRAGEGQGVAEGSCCFYLSSDSIEKTADGTVCSGDIQQSLCIRSLPPCAILSQVHSSCMWASLHRYC